MYWCGWSIYWPRDTWRVSPTQTVTLTTCCFASGEIISALTPRHRQKHTHTETHAHTHTHIHIHTHVHIPTHILWYTFLHLKVWESKCSAQMKWNPSCVLTWMIWFLIISCVVLLATCASASPRPDDGYGGFPFSRQWCLSLFSNYVVHHCLLFITSPNYDD